MLTTRDQRKRAAAKAIFDTELHARIELERNTPSDEQRRKALMQSCIAEAEAETAAQQHATLAPVRELAVARASVTCDMRQPASSCQKKIPRPSGR